MNDEIEFHKSRQMFFCRNGTIIIAPKGLPCSHYEWMGQMVDHQDMGQLYATETRGYVLGNKLVAYVGEDFKKYVNHYQLVEVVELFHKITPGGITTVGLGATPGPTQPWQPQIEMDAAEYIKKIRDGMAQQKAAKPNA